MAVIFLAAAAVFPGAAAAQEAEADPPNSHADLFCTECHETDPDWGSDTRETVNFYNDDEGIADLCYRCHDETENIHPIHMDPSKVFPLIYIPEDFPLEMRGEYKGTVVCTTCHRIHGRTAAFGLLRGLPESSRPEDLSRADFTAMHEFCKSCHRGNLRKMSPHEKSLDEGRRCSFCHATKPEAGTALQFARNPGELCSLCHGSIPDSHFDLTDPFSDPDLAAEIPGAGLPSFQGRATCLSCHDPHGDTEIEGRLRPGFIEFALKSTRVRPHFRPYFCKACHTVKPAALKGSPGAPSLAEVPLRSEDPNVLCNRCHDSGADMAHAHPTKEVPPDFLPQIPEDWPLHEGSVTCLTCHAPGDMPARDPANPYFLRGGPYALRNFICWNCHVREKLADVNPHQQIHLLKDCEICHVEKPSLEIPPEEQEIKFRADILLLCIRCHDDTAHPGNHDHTGLPSRQFMERTDTTIDREMPLDKLGRITCATCHNPHASGERRMKEYDALICRMCHSF